MYRCILHVQSVAVNRLVPFAKLKSQSDFANLNSAYDCLLLEVKFSIEDFILFAMVAAGDLMLLLRGWTEEIIAISFDGVDLFCISLKLRPLIMEPFVNKVYLHSRMENCVEFVLNSDFRTHLDLYDQNGEFTDVCNDLSYYFSKVLANESA